MIFAALLSALIAQATSAPTQCPNPNHEATIVSPVAPVAPPNLKAPAFALVEITIGPSGDLITATIYRSSGDPLVDRAAILAAKDAIYSPKVVNCVPVTGLFLFRAEVEPDDNVPPPTSTPVATFTPPDGWKTRTARTVPSLAWQSPLEWYLGDNKMTLGAATTAFKSIEENKVKVDAVLASTSIRGVTFLRSDIVSTCHGTQHAWWFEQTIVIGPAKLHSIDVHSIVRGLDYKLVFEARNLEPVPDAVNESLMSFCAPS